MKIVILGAPGAGKGTQAFLICEKYAIPHISTGDIFRANIKAGTELGREAKKYMDEGQLVPDELTTNLVVDRIQKEDCKNGYILDGFPRTIPQAECLTEALKKMDDGLNIALNIDVPDEVIMNRNCERRVCLTCGATFHLKYMPPKAEGICDVCGDRLVHREDDRPETVGKRLQVYHERTQPLIDYYKTQGILKTVDGNRDVNVVFAEIEKLLEA